MSFWQGVAILADAVQKLPFWHTDSNPLRVFNWLTVPYLPNLKDWAGQNCNVCYVRR
jgi:hypothetical protein